MNSKMKNTTSVPSVEDASNEITTEEYKQMNNQLHHRLRDPLNWTLNVSMICFVFIIIAMMVFKPGSDNTER